MAILNYNDPKWSKNLNCNVFGDCSGRTVSLNGAKGIAKLTNYHYSDSIYKEVFHLGIEVTIGLSIASCFNQKHIKRTLAGVGILTTLYLIGKNSCSC